MTSFVFCFDCDSHMTGSQKQRQSEAENQQRLNHNTADGGVVVYTSATTSITGITLRQTQAARSCQHRTPLHTLAVP